ncbi:MAG TPA: hypothetical protein PKD64_13910 [Pirellulaceae bacterium]|nr:hypothetical protein [Pirellulaceae bacterium]HMO93282.1 hypothetical protein [Pirellulaceae bacterium]HMP70178.1 hypothetical protein [Pirellulaceae bacterium]
MRSIKTSYQDPLDLIWISTANQLGIQIVRDESVNATWDGVDTLRLGTDATLDPDDCLAQMIFHELCHALVEGPDSFAQEDWGLFNLEYDPATDNPSAAIHEQACLRFQAVLSDEYGLRGFLAPTTDFRTFYDSLPDDPISETGLPDVILATASLDRFKVCPWNCVLRRALGATAEILAIVRPFASGDSLWRFGDRQVDADRSKID